MFSRRHPLLLALTAVLMTACAKADDAPGSNQLKLTTEKIVVFKDGYCLVIKKGRAKANADGEVFTAEVPDAAVLGSFWATPSTGRMQSMIAGWHETETEETESVTCTQTLEILKANQGRECSLRLQDRHLDGTILTVLAKQVKQPVTAGHRASLDAALLPLLSSVRPAANGVNPTATSHISHLNGSQFVLRTKHGDMLLNVAEVRELMVKDMKTNIARTITNKVRHKRLTFRLDQPNREQELLIAYFRPGIRWIPSYRIDLTPKLAGKQAGLGGAAKKVAEISMQAELINEAEDLLDAPIDIVVGVPNFRFRTITSPFTLERVLQNALQQSAPQLMGQFRNDFSNALYSQRSGEVRRNAAMATQAAAAGVTDLPDELTATGAQDLFVYNLPKMTLKKGERAALPIFRMNAPYRDVYTWDLHVKRNDIATAPSGSGVASPLVLSENKVWRQIELTNNSKLPWTTGAAMIMQGNQPLAQELLTYTSVKDLCRVPVTVAVDVRGSHSEQEFARQLKHLRWNGYDYARIQQKATLNVCNHKAEPIDLEIKLQFGGKADKASDDGAVTLAPYRAQDWERYRGDPAVNNSSVIRWKRSLKAGEVFEPQVEYHFYTRH